MTLARNRCKLVLEVNDMEINTKNQFSKNLAFFMKLKGVFAYSIFGATILGLAACGNNSTTTTTSANNTTTNP